MLLLAILVPQAVLIGPSLLGQMLVLPLDHLADKTNYLPRPPEGEPPRPQDGALSDLVFQTEVHRRLVVDEVRAGRVPLWNPYNYTGHPLLAANHTQVFSPYRLLSYAWPSPVSLAWTLLLQSYVAGVGAYLFFRRAMGVGWVAAVAGAAIFPLTGIIGLAASYPGAAVVSFLPWILLAADRCALKPSGKSVAALAVAVAFALLSGHAAYAGHVLLAGGVYFLWRHISLHGLASAISRPAWPGLFAATFGVFCGILLSAPQTLPTIEYLRSSQRIAQRDAGEVETPPAGPAALTQMVLPYAYGATQRGAVYIGVEGSRIESAAAGYAGLLIALVLMPVGWADRSRRKVMLFWTILALLAAAPAIGIPGIDLIFRLPPLSLFRNNRLVFVTAFAVLAMAVIGLNVLATAPELLRRWPAKVAVAVGGATALALLIWCAYWSMEIPLGAAEGSSTSINPLAILWPDAWTAEAPNPTDFDLVNWFALMYRNGVVLSLVALMLAATLMLSGRRTQSGRPTSPAAAIAVPALLAALAIAEVTAAASTVNVQTHPSLYYPRFGWMDLVEAKPGRLCGADCLPANLALSHRLRDIRGYDAADPLPTVELLLLAQDPTRRNVSPPYAVTRHLSVNPLAPGPVANLLGVRHIVGRGPPPPGANVVWTGQDYWLVENSGALDRVTLPQRAEVVPDKAARLRQLASPAHDPAAVALLESPLTDSSGAAGTATIADEHPGRTTIEVDLSRGGLVRFADAWNAGWRATYNVQPVEIIRIDHALMGVVVPAGKGIIEFRYEPASFRWGLLLAVGGLAGILLLALLWRTRCERTAAK